MWLDHQISQAPHTVWVERRSRSHTVGLADWVSLLQRAGERKLCNEEKNGDALLVQLIIQFHDNFTKPLWFLSPKLPAARACEFNSG